MSISEIRLASAGALLLDQVAAEAPSVKLRFLAVGPATAEAEAVRDGTADLTISVNAGKHADLHAQGLVREPPTAVVRTGHDLATGPVTPPRFAAWPHVMTSRRGRLASSLDAVLAERGHLRQLRISQLWHPRHHHDPAHQWLRRHITQTAALPNGPADDSPLP
jgi:DNA-binding transcriptional LysR family regulator